MLPHHLLRLLPAALALGLLSACVNESPLLDAHWSQSLTQARVRQTAYPSASATERGPIETDGNIARLGIERMHQSYENPPPPVNVHNLGMGTPTGSGSR